MDKSWEGLPAKFKKLILQGGSKKRIQVTYTNRYGRTRTFNANFEGVVRWLKRRHSEADSERQREWIEGYMREVPCSVCEGARLKPMSLAVTINETNIATI